VGDRDDLEGGSSGLIAPCVPIGLTGPQLDTIPTPYSVTYIERRKRRKRRIRRRRMRMSGIGGGGHDRTWHI